MRHPTNDHDCYLACAAVDLDRGEALARALTGRGWRVFWPDEALAPGEFRDDALPAAQRRSAMTVALISPGGTDDHELREAIAEGVRLARRAGFGHRVVPVLLDGIRLPFAPFVNGVVDADRLGGPAEIARALDALDPEEAGPAGLLADALLKGTLAAGRAVPLDPDLVEATARAVGGPGDAADRARATAAVFARALAEHPPTAVRLLRTLAEGAAGSRFATLDPAALRDGCVAAWEAEPVDDADAWASWASWQARDAAVELGDDPVERARAVMPRGDSAWADTWRRLWATRPGDGGLATDAAAWLEARRRPPALWVRVWEELLAGLGRIGDRAVLLLLGARWLRGRELHPAWPVVWRTLLTDPAGLPLGVHRGPMLRIGLDWLAGPSARPEWVAVWSTLFDAAERGADLDRRALIAVGRTALGDGELAAGDWARLWRRLLLAEGDEALYDLAHAWLLENEDDEAWASVWLALLDQSASADAERSRLVASGRAWLSGREAMGTWPVVLGRLLEEGVREPEVLAQAAAFIDGAERDHPVLSARLLARATARVPGDAVAARLAGWLAAHPDDRRVERIHAMLGLLAYDELDRRAWGPGWRALLAAEDDRRAAEERVWDRLSVEAAERTELVGRVIEVVKGGLTLDLGVPAFMPASQIERGVMHDREPYVGRELRCRIIRFDRAARRVVVSRTVVLDERRDRLLATLSPGDWIGGAVKRLEPYGAFVDLDGLDGLVHVGEITFGHVRHPRDRLRVGQRVRVRVIEVERDRGRVSLSLRDPTRDPWLALPARYPPGTWVEARVQHITHYGAFVEVEEGVEGLVHLSESSWARRPVEPVGRVGETVRVRVVLIDLARRRLTLSRLDPAADPWRRFARRQPTGSTARGRVVERSAEGAWVELDGPVVGWLPGATPGAGSAVMVRISEQEPGERHVRLEMA
ncbi:MAG: S1 RNA-binding domain-containing protein [Myxococcales bacterium]|nr:S1 RNA-binding domain-containing protein [Myxococcales bacterium]